MRRRLLYIVGGGVLVLVLLLIAIYYLVGGQQSDQPMPDIQQDVSVRVPPSPQPENTQTFDSVDTAPVISNGQIDDAVLIERNARIYAEKYGSHSNQSDFEGIDDLKAMSTANLHDWLDTYVEQLKEQYPEPTTYMGVSTVALAVQFVDLDASQAVVIVKTQRETYENNSQNPSVSRQDLRLEFEKVGLEWLVSAAYWQ